MLEKLKSRKLWVAIMMIVGVIGAGLGGTIELTDAISQALQIAMVYLGAQGISDAAVALKK